MEDIAEVYARALFEVASEQDKLDTVREQLNQFADMLAENRDSQTFFFSPYFSAQEKKEGLAKAVQGAESEVENFLATVIDHHRMPAMFRIRARFEALWDEVNKRLPVSIITAVPLDDGTAESIGKRIGEETGEKIELTSSVDPEIIGGIVLRVGNRIMDASIRTQLDNLRKQVAT